MCVTSFSIFKFECDMKVRLKGSGIYVGAFKPILSTAQY